MLKIKNITIVLAMLFVAIFAGCSSSVQSDQESGFQVATTFYPVEEIAKAIVQDTAEVNVIVGPGVEPHSYEPSPVTIARVSESDVLITIGGMFEHIEEDIENSNQELRMIHAQENIELVKGDEHDHSHDEHDEHANEEEHAHEEEEHMHEEHNETQVEEEHAHEEEHEEHHEDEHAHDDHEYGEYDPHTWLSIENMIIMTNNIANELIEIKPEYEEEYRANAQEYIQRLEELKSEYESRLSSCQKDVMLVNHKAFGYIAHEYGFEQVSVAGFSPEAEPSPAAIQRIIEEAQYHELNYIFSEGQLDPKVVETIATDIGAEVLELNPIKNSESEDYFSIMRANLQNIEKGLECTNN